MILTRNRNVWRIERAERAAVLIDATVFQRLARGADQRAARPFSSLDGTSTAEPGWSAKPGRPTTAFRKASPISSARWSSERPRAAIYLLVWDYSLLYAMERELLPAFSMRWRMPRRHPVLPGRRPSGWRLAPSEIVVVDDAIAFFGGQDVTIRRWDSTDHRPDDLRRIDPSGVPYAPFHDVQAVVDGRAALRLPNSYANAGERAPASARRESGRGAIPGRSASPRTLPESTSASHAPIRRWRTKARSANVEALFFDLVDRAERTIFIENQYLTATRFAERLAKRMLETARARSRRHRAQALPFMARRADHAGRSWPIHARFHRCRFERARGLLHPQVSERQPHLDIMVHSKVMIVDDRLAAGRIGQPEQPLVWPRYRVRPGFRGKDAGTAGGRSLPSATACSVTSAAYARRGCSIAARPVR